MSDKADGLTFSERGFAGYGELTDENGSEVRVVESSVIGRPKCHVFTIHDDPEYGRNPSPHLNVEQAEALVAMLQKFIAHAKDGDNWRNQKDYRDTFG